MATEKQTQRARKLLRDIGFPVNSSSADSRDVQQAVTAFQQGWSFGWLDPTGEPDDVTLSAIETCKERDGACSPHFFFGEFACHGTKEQLVTNELVLALEHARQQIGGKTLNIISGYRSPKHNRKIGGSPRSQHMLGKAADLHLPHVDIVKSWGVFTGIGAELATGQVHHVDVRDGDPRNPIMWSYFGVSDRGAAPQAWRDAPVTGYGLPAIAPWTLDGAANGNGSVSKHSAALAPILDLGALVQYVESKGFAASDTREHVERIVGACSGAKLSQAQTAYVLATAMHESRMGQSMEEFASGDAYENRADLGNVRPGDGRRFKGRGYVQLTGRANYLRFTRRLRELGHDVDLVAKPELALKPGIASAILVEGMISGAFTGRNLEHYINDGVTNFEDARRIINQKDKARQIAGYAKRFLQALDD